MREQLRDDHARLVPGSGIGVVVIGRNEGERLRACFASLNETEARVYVDSGSTDNSCSLARLFGFEVVTLAIPPGFTAARAQCGHRAAGRATS